MREQGRHVDTSLLYHVNGQGKVIDRVWVAGTDKFEILSKELHHGEAVVSRLMGHTKGKDGGIVAAELEAMVERFALMANHLDNDISHTAVGELGHGLTGELRLRCQ